MHGPELTIAQDGQHLNKYDGLALGEDRHRLIKRLLKVHLPHLAL